VTAAAPATCDEAIGKAMTVEPRRTIGKDAGFAIAPRDAIACITVATSKQNPHPAIRVCHGMPEVIAGWSRAAPSPERAASRRLTSQGG
jgi:uncharacterized protein (DUF736 family)